MKDNLIKLTIMAKDEESARGIAIKEHNVTTILKVDEINRIYEIIAVEHQELIKGNIKFPTSDGIEECRCEYHIDDMLIYIELIKPNLGLIGHLEQLFEIHTEPIRLGYGPIKMTFEIISDGKSTLFLGGLIKYFKDNTLRIVVDNFVTL
jgi:hypothetical protein